jgi:hypothetical protein
MALPYRTTGSLRPTFVPAPLVCVAVKHPYAFTLYGRFPIGLRVPLCASVTLSEVTAPVKLPTRHCPGSGLRTSVSFPDLPGWYFNVGSTGSRGLSVFPRVGGIFTPRSISLSPGSRQWGSRYAIRAGRNLPAKEFRYLRTVIVTAAVYRGFDSMLWLAPDISC